MYFQQYPSYRTVVTKIQGKQQHRDGVPRMVACDPKNWLSRESIKLPWFISHYHIMGMLQCNRCSSYANRGICQQVALTYSIEVQYFKWQWWDNRGWGRDGPGHTGDFFLALSQWVGTSYSSQMIPFHFAAENIWSAWHLCFSKNSTPSCIRAACHLNRWAWALAAKRPCIGIKMHLLRAGFAARNVKIAEFLCPLQRAVGGGR